MNNSSEQYRTTTSFALNQFGLPSFETSIPLGGTSCCHLRGAEISCLIAHLLTIDAQSPTSYRTVGGNTLIEGKCADSD